MSSPPEMAHTQRQPRKPARTETAKIPTQKEIEAASSELVDSAPESPPTDLAAATKPQ